MAEDKNSFVLYGNIIHTVKKLPMQQQAELFMTILQYVNDENPEVKDPLVDIAFEPIKQQLKIDLKKYEAIKTLRSEIGREGGKKSAEARKELAKQKQPIGSSAIPNEANQPVCVSVNGSVSDNEINRAKALVVSDETPKPPTKEDYEKLTDEYTGKDLTTVVKAMKEFIYKKPLFLEPYRDYWNIAVERSSLPKVKTLSNTRAKKLKTRIREPDFDFVKIISKVHGSQKLKSEGSWFSFDWILENEANYVKVLEGNYDN